MTKIQNNRVNREMRCHVLIVKKRRYNHIFIMKKKPPSMKTLGMNRNYQGLSGTDMLK